MSLSLHSIIVAPQLSVQLMGMERAVNGTHNHTTIAEGESLAETSVEPVLSVRASQGGADDSESVYQDPRVEAREKLQAISEQKQQQSIDREVSQLASRDREVRAHEQAHMAAGGQYAGAATYEYTRGPNGVSYAVGGEVSISVSQAPTPEESIRKAQVIRSAALAPAEPSSQDRKVASMASQMEVRARAEIAEIKKDEATAAAQEESAETIKDKASDESKVRAEPEGKPETAPTGIDSQLTSRISQIYSIDREQGILLSDHA